MPGIIYLSMHADRAVHFPAWVLPALQISIVLMLVGIAFMLVTFLCDVLGLKLPW